MSVPIVVTSDAKPYSDVVVSLTVVTYDATVKNAVNPSENITPGTEKVTLTKVVS